MKLLTQNFYTNLKKMLDTQIDETENMEILKKVDWEVEAKNCVESLEIFFELTDAEKLQRSSIEKIGVIDICWNEYGSDFEVDYMPSNDFTTAFDDGCIMNNHAIDNDAFFKKYFNTDGESAFGDIGTDYHGIIFIFLYLIEDIIEKVSELGSFKKLPKQLPCHVGISGYHDSERDNIFTID